MIDTGQGDDETGEQGMEEAELLLNCRSSPITGDDVSIEWKPILQLQFFRNEMGQTMSLKRDEINRGSHLLTAHFTLISSYVFNA